MTSHSFDERAATWDDEPTVARARAVAGIIADAVPLGGATRLLEYGAGTGLAAQFLAPHVGSVTLADPSAGMRAVAAEKVASGVLPAETRVWDLNLDDNEPPAEQFDLIVTVLALHHVADVPQVLAKLAGMLSAAGRLCIVDLEAEDGSFHGDMDGVAHGFAEATLTADLTAAGMTCDYRRGVYEIDKEGQPYPLFLAVCAIAS
jgi:ubiquinone/menaquinone biosynthesis C-methylase UbiE